MYHHLNYIHTTVFVPHIRLVDIKTPFLSTTKPVSGICVPALTFARLLQSTEASVITSGLALSFKKIRDLWMQCDILQNVIVSWPKLAW